MNFTKYQPIENKFGILVTCDKDKSKRSISEMYNLLNEYVEKLYPELLLKEEEDDASLSIEDSLKKEIEALKNESKEKKRIFQSLDTGVGGTYFMAIHEDYRGKIDPVSFVKRILLDLEETKESRTRFTSRIIPVQKTCLGKEEEVIRQAETLTTPVFNQGGPMKKVYE